MSDFDSFMFALTAVLHRRTHTWQHTRNMNKVIAVHSTFSLNWICWERLKLVTLPFKCHINKCSQCFMLTWIRTLLSGFWISGKTAQNGLITSKNLTEREQNNSLGYSNKALMVGMLLSKELGIVQATWLWDFWSSDKWIESDSLATSSFGTSNYGQTTLANLHYKNTRK